MKESELDQKEQNIYYNLSQQVKKVFKHCHELSFKTRERYENGVLDFARFMGKRYRKMNILKSKNFHVEAYAKDMQERGYSKSYVTTNLSAIRYFFDKALGGSFYVNINSKIGVEARDQEDRIGKDRAISDEDYQYLIAETKKDGRVDYQYAIEMGRKMGLRIHEVIGLRRSQIKTALIKGRLFVKGKSGFVRYLDLDKDTKSLLKDIIERHELKTDRIFVEEGEKAHEKIKELQKYIRSKNRNNEDRFTFHSLRHAYAQRNYKKWIDLGYNDEMARLKVSRELGHRRVSILKIYLNF